MNEFISTLVAGFAEAMPFFLVGSGLALTLGVMDILNFAHGVYFMIGAYVLHALLGGATVNLLFFLLACVGAGVVTGVVGAASERAVLRLTYRKDPLVSILATYGLFLLLQGLVIIVWGASPFSQNQSSATHGTLTVGGVVIARSDLLNAIVGLLVGASLYVLIRHSPFGTKVRATAEDREMASALGVATERISVAAFFIGTLLAALAGGLLAPQVSIDQTLGASWVLYAFIVVVVGGLGSVGGSFVAAVILGEADSLCVSYAPSVEPYILYIVVVALLLVRPRGLMGSLRHADA
ncbi:MAG TPA: branched-chain amino acid ABC transporter permease [Trebonia sp.]|jgi:branched-subunit amino acid ABC-type transport system permease component|nr:branched-chain amino acid ABC transporter permease [Trebonia sp.]